MSATDSQRIWRSSKCDDAAVRDDRLFCDGLARDGLVGIGFSYDAGLHVAGYFRRFPLCAGHDLKARVEVDHSGRELLQDACVALNLRGPVSDLRLECFCAQHRLLEIGTIDGERQVGLVGKKALNVGKCRVLKLNQEFLAVVRRD